MQRTLAIRAVAAYRTTSYDAATLLARTPPLYLMAAARTRAYLRIRDLRGLEDWSAKEEEEIKTNEDFIMRRQWELHLSNPDIPGARTRDAIMPVDTGALTIICTELVKQTHPFVPIAMQKSIRRNIQSRAAQRGLPRDKTLSVI